MAVALATAACGDRNKPEPERPAPAAPDALPAASASPSLEWSRYGGRSGAQWIPVPTARISEVVRDGFDVTFGGRLVMIDLRGSDGAGLARVDGPITILVDATTLRDPAVQRRLAEVVKAHPVQLTFELTARRAKGVLRPAEDEDAEIIAKLAGLHRLELVGAQITDRGLAALATNLRELRGLNLAAAERLTSTGLRVLGQLTKLEVLHLDKLDHDDSVLEQLRETRALRMLTLTGMELKGADGLAVIARLPALRYLGLAKVQRTGGLDAELRHVAGLAHLEVLDIQQTDLDGSGLAHLRSLARLEAIALSSNPRLSRGLAALGELARLESIDAASTALGDAEAAHLAKLTKVTHLNLNHTKVTTIAPFVRMPLEDLFVAGTQLDDAGLAGIERLASLVRLSLTDTRIGDASLERIAKLPKLDTLRVAGTAITDVTGLKASSITTLDRQNTKVSRERAAELLPNATVY